MFSEYKIRVKREVQVGPKFWCCYKQLLQCWSLDTRDESVMSE